jgi:hypothetical protein
VVGMGSFMSLDREPEVGRVVVEEGVVEVAEE